MGQNEKRAGAHKSTHVYRCFLVRCRLEEGVGPNGEPAWRFTVQQAGPDTPRHSFTCLKDVEAHLEAELAACAAPAHADHATSARSHVEP